MLPFLANEPALLYVCVSEQLANSPDYRRRQRRERTKLPCAIDGACLTRCVVRACVQEALARRCGIVPFLQEQQSLEGEGACATAKRRNEVPHDASTGRLRTRKIIAVDDECVSRSTANAGMRSRLVARPVAG